MPETGGPRGLQFALTIIVFRTISVGLSYAVITFLANQDYAAAKIQSLGEFGYVYLAVVLLSLTASVLVINTQHYRSIVGVPRPDQHLFKVVREIGPNAATSKPQGYAVLDDGIGGNWNRAVRGYENYLEYLPFLLINTVLGGYVYPYPTFALVCMTCLFRIIYAVSYTSSAPLRAPGFGLSLLHTNIIEGLVLIAGYKAISLL